MANKAKAAVVVLVALAGPACAMPAGMNMDCRWPTEDPLVLTVPSDPHHLAYDFEVAEELSIRYADRVGGRKPVSILGMLVRTGILATANRAEPRRECAARLFRIIADAHNVPIERVSSGADAGFRGADLPVNVPLAIFGVTAVFLTMRRVRRRFEPDERAALIASLIAASIVVAMAIVVFSTSWSGGIELLRVGNEHMSNRESRLWWPKHRPGLFIGSILLFWIVVFATRRSHER